jgi:hypothetical protein
LYFCQKLNVSKLKMVTISESINVIATKSMSISEIQQAFPDEWVLIGNPEFENANLIYGTFIAHGKDYLELCYKSQELTKKFEQSTIIFTGENKKNNRKWLKAIRLPEKA